MTILRDLRFWWNQFRDLYLTLKPVFPVASGYSLSGWLNRHIPGHSTFLSRLMASAFCFNTRRKIIHIVIE
jgi:hypothetical protein